MPNSGEDDMMEMVRLTPSIVHFSAHNALFYVADKACSCKMAIASVAYYLFREDCTSYVIRGYNRVFAYVNPCTRGHA